MRNYLIEGKRLRLNMLPGRHSLAEALISGAEDVEVVLPANAAGRLRVGATLTIGNYIAIPIIARFKKGSS